MNIHIIVRACKFSITYNFQFLIHILYDIIILFSFNQDIKKKGIVFCTKIKSFRDRIYVYVYDFNYCNNQCVWFHLISTENTFDFNEKKKQKKNKITRIPRDFFFLVNVKVQRSLFHHVCILFFANIKQTFQKFDPFEVDTVFYKNVKS